MGDQKSVNLACPNGVVAYLQKVSQFNSLILFENCLSDDTLELG